MSHTLDNKRIAKNTIYLYLRSLIIMVVSLYTSRVVLATLGFENHGLYNLIGSVVALFNMFSATFISSTQRFLNIEIGKGNESKTSDVFAASINIHFVLAVVIFILLETIGLWFLNNKLNIPEGRLFVANAVFQISIFTFLINITTVPYNALIISKEKMHVYAWISIYEATMKLAIIYLLAISPIDTLIFYSVLMALIPLSMLVFYAIYCRKKFKECQYKLKINNSLYKDMLSISGWNFLGSSSSLMTITGIGIILNIFTNVIVNSAKGISGQVENIVTQLVNNFTIALRPQITKSYSVGDQEYLILLVEKGTKMSFLLMCCLCFPIIILARQILQIWLVNTPQYTTEFVQITLIYLIQNSFSTILDILLLASGKIKYSQIFLSILQLLNIPFGCLILYLKCPPYMIYISFIIISYISLFVRLFFVSKYTTICYTKYLVHIFAPLLICGLIALLISNLIHGFSITSIEIINGIIKIAFIEIIFLFLFFIICLNNKERHFLVKKVKSMF